MVFTRGGEGCKEIVVYIVIVDYMMSGIPMKNILIIDAHPASSSLCSALVASFRDGAVDRTADVHEIRLRDLAFDPVLHEGYNRRQAWEPGLKQAWADIQWADHLCFVFPTWWGGHPALLQGFFERVFLPGKVVRFPETGHAFDRLMCGKTAQVLTTMDTPVWYDRWVYGRCGVRRVKQTILEFTGMKTRFHVFGGVKGSSDAQRQRWIAEAKMLGARAAAL